MFARQSLSRNLLKVKPNLSAFIRISQKNYNQVKDLDEIMETARDEEAQRTGKYLEYTHKVYKPSKTITFNRDGEILLFSCDNYKHVLYI